MNELEGKTAIVTGASSGIGRAAALTLVQAGAALVLQARLFPSAGRFTSIGLPRKFLIAFHNTDRLCRKRHAPSKPLGLEVAVLGNPPKQFRQINPLLLQSGNTRLDAAQRQQVADHLVESL